MVESLFSVQGEEATVKKGRKKKIKKMIIRNTNNSNILALCFYILSLTINKTPILQFMFKCIL